MTWSPLWLLSLLALTSALALAIGGSDAQAADPPEPWLESLAALMELIPAEFPPFGGSSTPANSDLSPAALDAIRAGEPLVVDNFSADEGRWSPDANDPEACAYVDGAYMMAPMLNLRATSVSDVTAASFLYEVDVAHIAGSEYDFAAGLVFRYADPDNYYRFEAQSNGAYTLIKRVNGETEILLEPVESPLLATGADFAARLGVLGRGAQLALLLDGSVLQTLEDTSLEQGAFGLYVRAPQRRCLGWDCVNPSPAAIAFDNLAIWSIESPQPLPAWTAAPTPVPTALPPAPATPTLPVPDLLPIDWQPLREEFDITHLRTEEILEANMALPAVFVLFEFEAVRDVGQVAYTAAFINAQGKVISAALVEFRPDPTLPYTLYDSLGGWRAGVRGTARFRLMADMSKVVKIRFVRDQ